MTSGEAVGPIDIQQLLDLLNASDRDEPRPNVTRPLIQLPEPQQHVEKVSPDPDEILPVGEPDESDIPALNEAENRFAAHIVHGMSKLKGG